MEKRKKKKSEYLKMRKLEMEKEAELASKYRDRAKERRAHQDNEDGEVAKENSDKVGCRMRSIVTNTFVRGIGRGMLIAVRISAILRR